MGKYTSLPDAYLSIIESLHHAGVANGVNVNAHLIDGEELDDANAASMLEGMDGVLVPGGFGQRAFEGKIAAARYARENNVPFLGICLGLHLLFERGDERTLQHAPEDIWAQGLGILPGSVRRLESPRLKVPHVGWDQIHLTQHGRECPLLQGTAEGANVYFTHSYALAEDVGPDLVTTRTHYTRSFASGVWHENVFGVQFHPEKSSRTGLNILRNYVAIVERGGVA